MNDSAHLSLRDLPIGISASGVRRETDSMGDIEVPADRYWGAQTQRSLVHFSIGDDRMPKRVYHAYGYVKKAAAIVNAKGGRLELDRALLCRVRYFCAGAVLGSRAFVERVFQSHRDCFGLNRRTAARPLREINAPKLFVARALRLRPLG